MSKGWHTHRTLLDCTKKLYKQLGIKRKIDAKQLYISVADKMFERISKPDSDASDFAQMFAHLAELNWMNKAKPTMFVEDGALITLLLESSTKKEIFRNTSIFNEQLFHLPFYCISPPRGFTYKGVEIEPFMIAIVSPHTQRHFLGRVILASSKNEDENLFVVFKYCADGGMMYSYSFTSEVADFLEEYERMPVKITLPHPRCKKVMKAFTEEERIQQRVMFELSVRLQLYIQSFPGQVRDGLPRQICQLDKKRWQKGKAITVSIEERFRNAPSAHFRSGHFRRLAHEKFKRDEAGNARVVYVNPCFVGEADIDGRCVS